VTPVAIDSIGIITAGADDAGGSVGCMVTGARRFDELAFSLAGAKTPIPDQVVGLDRLVQLGAVALDEAIHADLATAKIGLVVCAPSETDEPAIAGQNDKLLTRLAAESALTLAPQASRVFASGRDAIFEALPFARGALLQSDLAAICILGVDSLVTNPRLKRFIESGENPGAPVCPGEAAAAVVLTQTKAPHAMAFLRSIGTATEPSIGKSGQPNLARGILAAINATIVQAQWSRPAFSGLVHDMVGTAQDAEELAWAKTDRVFSASARMECLLPSASAGDTGAAAGVLSLATLAFLIDKGTWPGAGLCCFSSDAQRGAALLTPAQQR
jgi:3-oxoacyl-[acyl-carrier-protein] synthase-1